MDDKELLKKAYAAFDAANSADPNKAPSGNADRPKELVFAERLTNEVLALQPNASLELKLAARCQHICRWQSPRSSYPEGRVGYLKWRADLKKFHAEKAGEILKNIGAPDDVIERVQNLNLKKNMKSSQDCQTLEDALCIVFLKYQFDHLIESTAHEKMLGILRKTWKKMSLQGQKEALAITYSDKAKEILHEALGTAS